MVAVTADDFNSLPTQPVAGSTRGTRYVVGHQNPEGNGVSAIKDWRSEVAAVGGAEISKRLKEFSSFGKQLYDRMLARTGIKPSQSTRPRAAALSQARQSVTVQKTNEIIAKNPAPPTQTVALPFHVLQRRDAQQRVARLGLSALKVMTSELVIEAAAGALIGPAAAVALAFSTPTLKPDAQQIAQLTNKPQPSTTVLRNAPRNRASLNAVVAPPLLAGQEFQTKAQFVSVAEPTRPQYGRRLNPALRM